MRRSCVVGCAVLVSTVVWQPMGCAASRPGSGTEPCATGWMQIQGGVCIRFSKLEQSDHPPAELVAMDLLSRTGYVHLNLRVAVFRGDQKWCAFPGVLSLYQIEPDRQYAFRVPCPTSGTPVQTGEPRLVVEVDEAIEMPRRQ